MASDGSGVDGGPMFGFFLVTMSTALLLPYTLYRLKNKPLQIRISRPKLGRRQTAPPPNPLEPYVPALNAALRVHLIVLWVLYALLVGYTARNMSAMRGFDPHAILGVSSDASEATIRRAYRQLSLQFHPDKNPDPGAPAIQKRLSLAYEALTDPKRRANWLQFGHPDGQQAYEEGVALPSWINASSKSGSLVLLLGVLTVVVLPLALAMQYFAGLQH